MTDAHSPAAGWYDDPEMALRLRWWDGARWTTHTRPKPVIEHPAEQAITGRSALSPASAAAPATGMIPGTATIAEPTGSDPYAYSAPYSWSPGSVDTPGSSPAASAATPGTSTFGTRGSSARTPDEIWNTRASSIDYTPERSTTSAAWALAFTPVVTVLSQTAVFALTSLGPTPWVWLVGAAIMPVLWIIIWVRRDRIALYEWGHLQRAHWGWAFLTEVGYLTARTLIVRRQSGGRGWAPLLVNLLIIAVLVNVGIFTPVIGILLSSLV